MTPEIDKKDLALTFCEEENGVNSVELRIIDLHFITFRLVKAKINLIAQSLVLDDQNGRGHGPQAFK